MLAHVVRNCWITITNPIGEGIIQQSFDVGTKLGVSAFISQYRRQHCRALCFKFFGPVGEKGRQANASTEGREANASAEEMLAHASDLLLEQLRLATFYVVDNPKAIVSESDWKTLRREDVGENPAEELDETRDVQEVG